MCVAFHFMVLLSPFAGLSLSVKGICDFLQTNPLKKATKLVIKKKEKELQADKKNVYSLMMIHSLLKCRQHICLAHHFQGVSYSYSFISFHCLYDIFYLLINARIKTKKNLAFGISFVYLSNIGKHSKMRNVFHSYFMLPPSWRVQVSMPWGFGFTLPERPGPDCALPHVYTYFYIQCLLLKFRRRQLASHFINALLSPSLPLSLFLSLSVC